MTKSQIKAELRRSACEDRYPWSGVSGKAHAECFYNWCHHDYGYENMLHLSLDDLRTFFLLVAEAL